MGIKFDPSKHMPDFEKPGNVGPEIYAERLHNLLVQAKKDIEYLRGKVQFYEQFISAIKGYSFNAKAIHKKESIIKKRR